MERHTLGNSGPEVGPPSGGGYFETVFELSGGGVSATAAAGRAALP